MKTFFTISIILMGFSAQASYFQENCSSADQAISQRMGHSETGLTVTERFYSSNRVIENKIKLPLNDENLQLDVSDEKEISSTYDKNCDPQTGTGYASWSKIRAKKLTISKKDGSQFSKNIVGVSPDQKSISSYVLCENNGNSMIMCEKN